MEVINSIITRRSVRNYNGQEIECNILSKLVEAAIYAPSGKNGQPWKFKIVTKREEIELLSSVSIYENWMRNAACMIVVFLDEKCSYHYVKDVQSCGAAIQNILLTAHSMGIGSCWIGEVLDKADRVKSILQVSNSNLYLMGVITLGYSDNKNLNAERRSLETFLV